MTRLLHEFFMVIFLGWLSFQSQAQAAEAVDFETGIKSLTNKIRAHHLRVESMEALSVHHPDKLFPILVSILQDTEETPPLRVLAAHKLYEINPPKAEKLFLLLLEDPKGKSFVRKAAFAELATQNAAKVKSFIRKAMDDRNEDPAVRQYALALYSQQEGEGRLEKLRKMVGARDETLSIRSNALFLLESLEDDDFVRRSIRLFLRDQREPEELRSNCMIIAQRLADEESFEILKRIAADSSESLRLRELAKTVVSNQNQPLSVHASTSP